MEQGKVRLIGIELYYSDLDAAKHFYRDTLGFELAEEEPGHHAKFDGGAVFICLERKGTESYPSRDKAVVFLEVSDLHATMERIGQDRFIGCGGPENSAQVDWAVLHDPEGYNVLLLQSKQP
jgi:catechol 2,3-dioxygenase-like lactoylglutathione lyase family enzyme